MRGTRRIVIATVMAIAVLINACGGDDNESSSETTTTDAGSTAPTTVRFANFGHFASTVIWDHAIVSGYFEDNGVKLEETAPIFNAAQIVQSMEQGQADMVLTGATGVYGLAAAGRPVKYVANNMVGFPTKVLLGTKALERLKRDGITPDASFDDKVEALKGLTLVGTAAGSSQDVAFRYVLDSLGLEPDKDLTIQPLSDAAAITAAVREGQVDGMFTLAGGADVQAPEEGWGEVFISFAEEDDTLAELPLFALAASPKFITEHPEAVEGVIRAFVQARDDVLAGLTGAQLEAIRTRFLPDLDADLYERQVAAVVIGAELGGPVPTKKEFEALKAVNDSVAAVPSTITFEDLYSIDLAKDVAADS